MLLVLICHIILGLGLLVFTLRQGEPKETAYRWAVAGLLTGFLAFGAWCWKYKYEWGLWEKMQGIAITLVLEIAVVAAGLASRNYS